MDRGETGPHGHVWISMLQICVLHQVPTTQGQILFLYFEDTKPTKQVKMASS